MEGILNLLRKFGYTESEIKNVLEKVPIEQQGKVGPNVSTGIFSKPKEGELSKDFLIVNKIENPFEIDYYKGRSRDDIIKSSEEQLKMMNDGLIKVASQIVNKNLKLTDEQLSQFSKNIETKRRFEKDFEAFKSQPEADVLDITTKEKVGDVEALKEKSGLIAPPTTDIGRIELRNKLMIQKANELIESEASFEKQEALRQSRLKRMYEGKGYEGGVFGPSGIYRAVGRDFLLDQNAKGIIKLDKDVVKSLEDRNYISGGQALLYPDPIRIMRFHYGDDIFDKIPLDQLNKTMGGRSDILEAMSKVETKPIQVQGPKTPGGYMTPGEIIANIEDMKEVEKLINRREGIFSGMNDQEIERQLGHYGARKGAFEMSLEYDHPKAYGEYNLQQGKNIDLKTALKDFKFLKPRATYDFGKDYKYDTLLIAEDMADHVYKKEFDKLPQDIQFKLLDAANEEYMNLLAIDGYANGGRVSFANGSPKESLGLDYLMGMERSYAVGGRVNFQKGTVPRLFEHLINKLVEEKNFNRKLLEQANPKAIQELYIQQFGKLPSAEEIKDIVNKQLQGKYSMESINPKTGEVTTPTEPVKVAEEPRTLGGLPIAEEAANIGDKLDELSKAGIDTFEKQKQYLDLRLQFIDSLDPRRQNKALDNQRKSVDTEQRLLLKAEKKGLDFDTFEKLRTGLYGSRKQKTLDFIKTGKVDVEPLKTPTTFQEVRDRYKNAAKAHEEIQPNFNDPRTAASSLADVMAEQKYGKVFDDLSGDKQQELYVEAYNYISYVNQLPKVSPQKVPLETLEYKMNQVLNQYDKSMFIKNEQGMVDVTNPENIEKMALLLKRDHPEIYNEIFNLTEDLSQKQQLLDFDVTGRKPNATGGRVGYAEGSGDAPSITLDSYKNSYPIKIGNTSIGINALINAGKKFSPNPYVNVSNSDRNIFIRGRYDVPESGIYLTGNVGDTRSTMTRDVNVPQYDIKETVRETKKDQPYSVGVGYSPDENKDINLTFDDKGNVMLKGEYKFKKGGSAGLNYLMGL